MSPGVAAAWIGVLGVLVGGTGTAIVAIAGFRSTRRATDTQIASASTNIQAQIAASSADIRAQIEAGSANIQAQIEADRRNRVWEKQAAIYVDALEAVHYWQVRRQLEVRWTPLGDDERLRIQATLAALRKPDWNELEARLQAFASEPVFTAMQESNMAESYVVDRFKMWQDADAMVMAWRTEQNLQIREVNFNSLWKASMTAEHATNHVIEVIRTELQGGGPPLRGRTYTQLDRLRDHLPEDPGTEPAGPPATGWPPPPATGQPPPPTQETL
jgi:hypothetical protein